MAGDERMVYAAIEAAGNQGPQMIGVFEPQSADPMQASGPEQ